MDSATCFPGMAVHVHGSLVRASCGVWPQSGCWLLARTCTLGLGILVSLRREFITEERLRLTLLAIRGGSHGSHPFFSGGRGSHLFFRVAVGLTLFFRDYYCIYEISII